MGDTTEPVRPGALRMVVFSNRVVVPRAMFRLRMAGGGIAGAAYLARLSFSPTQEDWKKGAEERRSWLWDAARRPFRLFRKYGTNE